MARGLPDDANVLGYGNVYRSDDVTELAARLGSPLTYERRGNVLHSETFALGAATWTVERDGNPETSILSADYNIVGGAALLLANTSGSPELLVATRSLPLFSDARYGLFVMASMGTGTVAFQVAVVHYDGTHKWTYIVKLSSTLETLLYGIEGGSDVELTDVLDFFSGEANFHALALIVDTADNAWRQVTMDGTLYDLTGITPYKANSGTAPRMDLVFTVIPENSAGAGVVIDSVVLVQNPTVLN